MSDASTPADAQPAEVEPTSPLIALRHGAPNGRTLLATELLEFAEAASHDATLKMAQKLHGPVTQTVLDGLTRAFKTGPTSLPRTNIEDYVIRGLQTLQRLPPARACDDNMNMRIVESIQMVLGLDIRESPGHALSIERVKAAERALEHTYAAFRFTGAQGMYSALKEVTREVEGAFAAGVKGKDLLPQRQRMGDISHQDSDYCAKYLDCTDPNKLYASQVVEAAVRRADPEALLARLLMIVQLPFSGKAGQASRDLALAAVRMRSENAPVAAAPKPALS